MFIEIKLIIVMILFNIESNWETPSFLKLVIKKLYKTMPTLLILTTGTMYFEYTVKNTLMHSRQIFEI